MLDFASIVQEESANGSEVRLYAGAQPGEWYAFERSAFFVVSHGCLVCEKGCVAVRTSTIQLLPIRRSMVCVRLTLPCLEALKEYMELKERSATFMRFSFVASFGGFDFWKDRVKIVRKEICIPAV